MQKAPVILSARHSTIVAIAGAVGALPRNVPHTQGRLAGGSNCGVS